MFVQPEPFLRMGRGGTPRRPNKKSIFRSVLLPTHLSASHGGGFTVSHCPLNAERSMEAMKTNFYKRWFDPTRNRT